MHAPIAGISTPFQIGLKPLDGTAWIDVDDQLHLYLDKKQRVMSAHAAAVFAAEPGTEARKIGDLYTSFMDTERIEALGAAPLREQLARIDRVDSIPALLRTVGELEREGVGGLFGTYIEPDPGNPERYVVFIVQSGLSLPDESYYRLENFAKTRTAFRDYAATMLGLAGVEDASAPADRILALETEIASHHWDNVRSRDAVATYNLMSWDDVQALVGVDLSPWLDAVAPGFQAGFAEINVNQPSALEGLGTLLTEERLDDWKAWLRLHVVRASAAFLSSDFVDANFAFYGTELTGVPVNRERWKRGVGFVEAAMGEAVGKVYVERHFPPAAKEAMDELVANLIEAYRQSISALEWMRPATRERALEKLAAFTPKVGFPATWKDYSALEVDPADLGVVLPCCMLCRRWVRKVDDSGAHRLDAKRVAASCDGSCQNMLITGIRQQADQIRARVRKHHRLGKCPLDSTALTAGISRAF